jgi:3-hydroxyisobutyrate dehydrogenase-like beta-hydroxyacid dehydrogenase
MSKDLKLGLIGFGEAGYNIASGLRSSGLSDISAFDIHTQTPGRGEKIRSRADEVNVRLCESNEDLASRCDVLFSTVTANQAHAAASATAPFLAAKHVYADLNSVSPDLKRTIAAVIKGQGARFVEIAIMSPVYPLRHRAPMFLGGPNARALAALFTPYEMNMEVVSEEIGAASAIKMCRSIIMKGLEALLMECVLAAVPYGADERVFSTLDETIPGIRWSEMAGYMVARIVEHGERRAREMEEVAATLRAIDIDPVMTEAIIVRQDWGASLGLLAHFDGKPPTDYREIVDAIRAMSAQER